MKKYQSSAVGANALAVPEQVTISMEQIAANVQEGLLALAVGSGLQVMSTLMEIDVTALAGPKGATRATGPRCATATSRAV